jgi:D-3-phosphoglycerate dehydrogenase
VKVLIADKFEQSGRDGLAALGCEVVNDPEVAAEALPELLAKLDPEVLIVRSKRVKAPAVQAGRSLKGIIRAGAGYDNIDLKTATDRAVAVCNCPGMNAVAVAELTIGLLIACDRRIADQAADLRAGRWNKKEYAVARGLKSLTLGVIGMGFIGREVIKRVRAFDMKVIAHSLDMTLERARDLGVEFGGTQRSDLLARLPRCDAVTVHVAATPESERMCDRAFFAAMKPGSYFINTSRGSVVDEAALRDAVTIRGIRAGLDVYDNEPAEGRTDWSCPTAALPGVVGTHHVGASTDQAQSAVADEVVRLIRVYRDTGQFENRVY